MDQPVLSVAVALCMCVLGACRIQRGGDVPEEPARAAPRGAAAAGAAATAVAPTGTSSAASPSVPNSDAAVGGAPSAEPKDAGVPAPTRIPDAGDAPRPSGSTAPQTPAADGCGRGAMVEGCNPVTNEGCAQELGMQCDVDVSSSKPRGVCVFSAPPPDAGACLNIPPTESCAAGETCVDFSACRKLCLCDDDCDAGDCCTDALGSTGFKTCSTC